MSNNNTRVNNKKNHQNKLKKMQQSLPQQSLPQQSLPQQALPQQSLHQQSLPQQALPQQVVHIRGNFVWVEENDFIKLQTENAEYAQRIYDLNRDAKMYNETIHQNRELLSQNEETIKALKKENKRLKEKLKQLESKVIKLEETNSVLKADNEALKTEVKELKMEVKNMKEEDVISKTKINNLEKNMCILMTQYQNKEMSHMFSDVFSVVKDCIIKNESKKCLEIAGLTYQDIILGLKNNDACVVKFIENLGIDTTEFLYFDDSKKKRNKATHFINNSEYTNRTYILEQINIFEVEVNNLNENNTLFGYKNGLFKLINVIKVYFNKKKKIILN
jgi:chromosome segregation ATPase